MRPGAGGTGAPGLAQVIAAPPPRTPALGGCRRRQANSARATQNECSARRDRPLESAPCMRPGIRSALTAIAPALLVAPALLMALVLAASGCGPAADAVPPSAAAQAPSAV